MQIQPKIDYELTFLHAAQHLINVSMSLQLDNQQQFAHIDLMLPVWTPGSYMVREYARQLEDIRAFDAEHVVLPITKISKNRWRVPYRKNIHISYKVYGREMTVRTNWIDRDFALINGAPTFLTWVDGQALPHHVHVVLPPTWQYIHTALPPDTSNAHRFIAANYDTLVDSPWLLGNAPAHDIEVNGVPHRLVIEDNNDSWDIPICLDAFKRIAQQHAVLWGVLPYQQYVLLNIATGSYGGLEHRDSAVLMTRKTVCKTRQHVIDWFGLVSHELFHAWNVKRLRPIELCHVDYEHEVPTRSLWIVEGLTAYYDDLQICRAGLITQDEYLTLLGKNITALQTTPGRMQQSVAEASFDAWIKFYRRDENTDNASVSYYIKGACIGFVLDAYIREISHDSCSLDDIMRAAYARFVDNGYEEAAFRAIINDVLQHDCSQLLHTWVDTTAELSYTQALDFYGLAYKPVPEHQPWLGIKIHPDKHAIRVSHVVRDGPAYHAGINVDDEIIGINHHHIIPTNFQVYLNLFHLDAHVTLIIARRERLLHIPVKLGSDQNQHAWHLQIATNATLLQQKRRNMWLQ